MATTKEHEEALTQLCKTCRCNNKESECSYPKCHNGEWDAAQIKATVAASYSEAMHDVLAERRRQIDTEGWTTSHDDAHVNGELARAGAAYAAHSATGAVVGRQFYSCLWPFGDGFKPSNPRKDLVKATALLLAEIERLDRRNLNMTTPKEHSWPHDGEYCHVSLIGEAADAARSVCEGMYADKENEKERLKEALRAVYALAGENPEVRKIINTALDEAEFTN